MAETFYADDIEIIPDESTTSVDVLQDVQSDQSASPNPWGLGGIAGPSGYGPISPTDVGVIGGAMASMYPGAGWGASILGPTLGGLLGGAIEGQPMSGLTQGATAGTVGTLTSAPVHMLGRRMLQGKLDRSRLTKTIGELDPRLKTGSSPEAIHEAYVGGRIPNQITSDFMNDIGLIESRIATAGQTDEFFLPELSRYIDIPAGAAKGRTGVDLVTAESGKAAAGVRQVESLLGAKALSQTRGKSGQYAQPDPLKVRLQDAKRSAADMSYQAASEKADYYQPKFSLKDVIGQISEEDFPPDLAGRVISDVSDQLVQRGLPDEARLLLQTYLQKGRGSALSNVVTSGFGKGGYQFNYPTAQKYAAGQREPLTRAIGGSDLQNLYRTMFRGGQPGGGVDVPRGPIPIREYGIPDMSFGLSGQFLNWLLGPKYVGRHPLIGRGPYNLSSVPTTAFQLYGQQYNPFLNQQE